MLEERDDRLRSGVRLRQSRGAGLHKDLRFAQVGSFVGEVGIFDARLGRGIVRHLALCQVGRVVEEVFTLTDSGLRGAQSQYGVAERGNGVLRVGQRADVSRGTRAQLCRT